MKNRILNGVEEERASIIEREFNASPRLRERLIEVLKREQEHLYVSMRSNDFNEANWQNIHAYKLGEVKTIQKLISLLE